MVIIGIPLSGTDDLTAVYGFTTLGDLHSKLKQLAADHQIDFSIANLSQMTKHLQQSYNTIREKLVARGLTFVQVSTWTRGEEYQLDIATYWYARGSGWGGKLEEEKDWVSVFNRVKELDEIAIVNNDGNILLNSKQAVAVHMDLVSINSNLSLYP